MSPTESYNQPWLEAACSVNNNKNWIRNKYIFIYQSKQEVDNHKVWNPPVDADMLKICLPEKKSQLTTQRWRTVKRTNWHWCEKHSWACRGLWATRENVLRSGTRGKKCLNSFWLHTGLTSSEFPQIGSFLNFIFHITCPEKSEFYFFFFFLKSSSVPLPNDPPPSKYQMEL